MRGHAPCILMVLALLGGGCAGEEEIAGPGGLDESASSARLEAIGALSDQPSDEQLIDLIRSLRSDDPLVRSAAIYTLRRVTGTDRGFVAVDPDSVRDAAADRWDLWLERRQQAANTSHGLGSGPTRTNPTATDRSGDEAR